MANSEGTPLHGDRSAWNTTDFAGEHARDIDESALLRHLPAPASDGNFAVDDGTNWVAEGGATARTSLGLVAGGAGDIWVEKAGDTMTGALIIDGTADTQQLIVQAHSTQTSNLHEWQKSDGTVLAAIQGRGTYYSDLGGNANNLFIGKDAGTAVSGTNTLAIGVNAGQYLGSGSRDNLFIGTNSGKYVTTGDYNVGLGTTTLGGTYPMTGNNNMAIGASALRDMTTGSDNVGIGNQAGTNTEDGIGNIAIGRNALPANKSGDFNIAFGQYAGNATTAGQNVFIGGSAGYSNTSGASNIFFGYQSGYRQTTNSNLFIIDNQVRADVATELTNSILYGVMAAAPADQSLRVNAHLNVSGAIQSSTTTLTAAGPTDNLDVSGVNTVFIDTSGNDVTLGGTTGGVDGQVLYVVVHDATNDMTVEHNEGVNQSFILHAGADETMTSEYGGWVFVCEGGDHWHDCSHAKHV